MRGSLSPLSYREEVQNWDLVEKMEQSEWPRSGFVSLAVLALPF